MSVLEQEPLLEADDIQGNVLRGFATRNLEVLGFKFEDPVSARSWLGRQAGQIHSVSQVHDYRLRRSGGDPATATEILVNAALSRYGLDALGVDSAAVGDGFFNLPMGKLAGALGDRVLNNAPVDYVIGQDRSRTPDILLLLGCEEAAPLNAASADWQAQAAKAGLRLIFQKRGAVLPGEIEHFGYRDGLSQPGPRGLLPGDPPKPLTPRVIDSQDPGAPYFGRPGQPLIWPGQFVFGYPTQSEDPLTPGPVTPVEPWMHNGSLLVFRILRQDVPSFRAFLETQAPLVTQATGQTFTPRQIGAGIVGRWEDGTPTVLSPQQPDPAIASDPMRANHFAYAGVDPIQVIGEDGGAWSIPGHDSDETGMRCPFSAHIRKVNPRNLTTDQGTAERTAMFHVLRRGIPYGVPYQPDEEETERGLLFLAYQTSFENQFRTLNNLWMNNANAPERDSEGQDLLVGQNPAGEARFGTLRDATGGERARLETLARWVIPQGGAFLFVPSLRFFRALQQG